MNKFCTTCQHKDVPSSLKEKYSKYIFELFVECPMNDENICGCTSKYIGIDWKAFLVFLKKRNALNITESEFLQKYED